MSNSEIGDFGKGTLKYPLHETARLLFASSARIKSGGGLTGSVMSEGLLANLYAGNWSTADPNVGCAQYFNDPMDYMINSYRDIAFRMSIRFFSDPIYNATGNRLSHRPQRHIPYTRHFTKVQYASHIPALVLATIVSLAGPLATLVLFWGWWRLGREFTMSPLELANAMLQHQQPGHQQPRSEQVGGGSSDVVEQSKTVTEETITAVKDTSSSGECDGHPYHYRHQKDGQQDLAGVFASCSGSDSADRLAGQFRRLGRRTGNSDSFVQHEGEPLVQYGAVHNDAAGGRLGFAVVSGSQGGAVGQPVKGGSV